jgi:Domain of unknown function DUF11
MPCRRSVLTSTFVLATALAGNALAQGIPAADVKIQTIQATVENDQFVCTVQVHNDNDDDARAVKVVILFPLEVEFVSSTRRCAVGPPYPAQGWTQCRLGTMTVGEVKSVTVRTTAPTRNRTCSAFVWNNLPDPNPVNNFGQSTAP